MSPSALALVGYTAWMLLLSIWIIGWRTVLVFTGKFPANAFTPGQEEISPLAQRLGRAHANCYENLPMFAALVLVAMVTGNAAITDPLARWLLVARVAQSSVHVMSTSVMAVNVRGTLQWIQLLIMAYWVVQLGLLGFQ